MKIIKLLNVNIQRVITLLFIFLMIISSILMAVNDKEVAATICILSFSLGLAFINLDKFSSIKVAGFEALLKGAVKDAYTAIDELKSVAVNVSKPTVSLLALKNGYSFLSLKIKLEYANNISKTLQELKVTDSEAEEILSSLYDRVEEDHRLKILHAINNELDNNKKIQDIYGIDMDEWPLARLKSHANEVTVNIDELLVDYQYFIDNKALRSPEDESWQG